MVKTSSTMLELGTAAPGFTLPDSNGNPISLSDFAGKPLLVSFICNHCPYVKHLADDLGRLCREAKGRGLAVVGINSNDIEKYPDDGPEAMKEEAALRGYDFPYLLDESQKVAQEFRAACTPDFFLFDADHHLVYRGQYDSTRPKQDPPQKPSGKDLQAAIDSVLAGEKPSSEQTPSLGCNIKWKEGQAPAYFQST